MLLTAPEGAHGFFALEDGAVDVLVLSGGIWHSFVGREPRIINRGLVHFAEGQEDECRIRIRESDLRNWDKV